MLLGCATFNDAQDQPIKVLDATYKALLMGCTVAGEARGWTGAAPLPEQLAMPSPLPVTPRTSGPPPPKALPKAPSPLWREGAALL